MGEEVTWRVVGGGNKGGIVVREGKALTSPESGRLATGSLLRQLELSGDRLRFSLFAGSGPQEGWVSVRVGGKDIVVNKGCVPVEQLDFGKPIFKDPRVVGAEVWILASPFRNAVQSLLALALGLLKANYKVRVFGPACFEGPARSFGVPYTVAGLTLPEFQNRQLQWGDADSLWDWDLYGREHVRDMISVVLAALQAAGKVPDVLCYELNNVNVAIALYHKCGVSGQMMLSTGAPVEGWDHRTFMFYAGLDSVVEELMGIAPTRDMGFEGFYGVTISPRQLIGVTAAELETCPNPEISRDLATKLGGNFCGYWNLPPDLQVQCDDDEFFGGRETVGALEAFVNKEKAVPVYMGWGNKIFEDQAAHVALLAVGALKRLGSRGIILSGDSGPSLDALAAAVFPQDTDGLLSYASANVLFIRAAPHEWLFPRCSCIVHHGGAGTTATALRGMVPQLVTPTEGKHWQYGAWVEKLGTGVCFESWLGEATATMLAEALKRAREPALKAKAVEVGTAIRAEGGVRNAVAGLGMFYLSSVKTGQCREEHKKAMESIAKEAAFQRELEEEPEDGVLRPQRRLLVAGPDPGGGVGPGRGARGDSTGGRRALPPAVTTAQEWLHPDGKAKILTWCTPLKGHVIHFRRIAQWFLEKAPGYEVHMALMVEEADLPPGVHKHVMDSRPDAGKTFEQLNGLFAKMAGLEPTESVGDGNMPDMLDANKFIMETFFAVMPNVLITEECLVSTITENFMPALCRTYNTFFVSIVPMCIKENMRHSMQRVHKTLERRNRLLEQQGHELWAVLAAEEGDAGEDGGAEAGVYADAGGAVEAEGQPTGQLEEEVESKDVVAIGETGDAQQLDQQGGAQASEGGEGRPDWLPEAMSMGMLNHILWKVIPEMQWQPHIKLYPSPGFFHAEKPEAFEIFCTPFLPLPALGRDGATQHGRTALEGNVGRELLDWLYCKENDDPIVYVAFGTIVSQFNSRKLVERLVEALGDAPWRVLLVLPENAREGLPKEGETNSWRWTALGAATFQGARGDFATVRDGDVFTEEHLVKVRSLVQSQRLRSPEALEEVGLISLSKASVHSLQPSRWRVEKFVPQVHVLRCERVRCFMSHNGANSTLESMACGVPMLCTPFFMDQYDWAHTVRTNLRAGIQVDKILTDAAAIRGAVRELLEEPAYRRNAQAVARRIAAQSEQVARVLGPAMEPKASLGPGLSVLAALCVSHIKGKDLRYILDMALR